MEGNETIEVVCDHTLVCIYRHPTSDQRCTKCGEVFRYADAIRYNVTKSYNEGKISLTELRRTITV